MNNTKSTAATIPSIPASWEGDNVKAVGHVTLESGSILLHCWAQWGESGQDLFISAKGTGYFTRPYGRDGVVELYSFPAGSPLRYRGNPVRLFVAGGMAEQVKK